MRLLDWFTEFPLVLAVFVNGLLGAILGGLLAGLRGAKGGMVAGMLLALLPFAVRGTATWLARPDGVPRLVGREIGAVAIRGGAAIVEALRGPFGALARSLQRPVLVLRFAAFFMAGTIARAFGAAGQVLTTPLGLANLVALAVIAANLAGLEFATLGVFLGFALLLLVLAVDEYEIEDGASR